MDRGSKQPTSGIPRLSSRLPVPQRSLRDVVSSNEKSVPQQEVARSGQSQDVPEIQRSAAGVTPQTRRASFRRANEGRLSRPKVASATDFARGSVTSSVSAPEIAGDTLLQGEPIFGDEGQIIEPVTVLTFDQGCGNSRVSPDAACYQPETPRVKRKPRPSLSDRTIETLSQIPPSPSENRRRSCFFGQDTSSPMRPPLRPASAMSSSRSRPSSPSKPPPVPALPAYCASKSNISSVPGRRSITQPAKSLVTTPGLKARIHATTSTAIGTKSVKDHESSKSISTIRQTNTSQAKPSVLNSHARKPLTNRQPVAASQFGNTNDSRNVSTMSKSVKPSSNTYRGSSVQALKPFPNGVDAKVEEPSRDFSKSSAGLRNAIAKAKKEAARKNAPAGHIRQSPAPFVDAPSGFGASGTPMDSNTSTGLLRQRIKAALLSGHLNMAAMGLKSIPVEIKGMYDLSEEHGVGWSECVDLTKFVAADNDLEKLEDDWFPDKTDAELEDVEGPHHCGQFRGLEILDLHSNALRELPLGLRRLQKLRSLNLSGNKLGIQGLDTICQIGENLTELKLADNEVLGILPREIENLRSLQVLDLHANKITELPDCLKELQHLRVLNLSQNKLSSFPSELLVNSSLVELLLSGNKFSGTFLPTEIQSMASLKQLDVSYNAIEALACQEVALPNLQTMNLSGNRIKTLPDVSSWTQLLTIAVAENLISDIPTGLVQLAKLRNADLSNNNITRLDEGLASMENLISINLIGNPVRERKYLTMSTEDLKADLLKRTMSTDASFDENTTIPNSTPGTGGLIDLSSKSLSDSNLPTLNPERPIFELRLHHNKLTTIPASLLSHPQISQTLKSLSLSHNALQTLYLSTPLTLPNLQDLSLTSCTLPSLQSLLTHLSAPSLTTLNVSANRLCGPVPNLHPHFPLLTTLLAADNRFDTLDVEAVRGLHTLDLRNNEIGFLEPRLGLLGGLKALEVRGNRFRVPRWDVLDKGTEAVLRWLRGRVPEGELEGVGGEGV